MDFTRRILGEDDDGRWRDTMLVCLEGHVITDRLIDSPEDGKKCCPKDGSETLSECPSCKAAIPGTLHGTGVVIIGSLPRAPERCENCGSAFPWTGKAGASRASVIAVADVLDRIFEHFPLVARQMRQRHGNRPTLDVQDEYDVQDLLHGLLRLWWDDIREEEWTPSYAGRAARVDFLLQTERCVIETKMARVRLTHKEVGSELLIDIARYSQMSSCDKLFCFVFDPHGYVKNPRGLERDLAKESRASLQVRVFVRG
jgi:hypothetical protein